MAVLALTVAGSAIGNALLPGGLSVLGATISGAALGGAIGGIAGSAIDQYLLAPTVRREGPRLTDLQVQTSTEGGAVLRVFGRMRVGPTIIWATTVREERSTSESGGKGGPRVSTTTYRYFATFAIGLCEGPIVGVERVWADGKVIDLGEINVRVHHGREDQQPDPIIEAVQGAGSAPAYRGLAYMVFEDLALEPYGNRIPQFTVEVVRTPDVDGPRLETMLTAVAMIPGAGEFAYEAERVQKKIGVGEWEPVNVHAKRSTADFAVALADLKRLAPNVEHVSLVVAWHGTDLRCGQCEIKPKVEASTTETWPVEWRVSGLTRGGAAVVSQIDDRPALGGAPSDGSVFRAIRELGDHGYEVTLYPFIMMDIAAGNSLPDPYGGTGQPAYPWRGRITCHPAAGEPGTVDQTSVAADQVAAFFGEAEPGDFTWSAAQETVLYTGPNEWSFRRLILHYATLAAAAGGVNAFLIGSEMIGLTTIRSDANTYPAVARFKTLAADVRSIVGSGTKIGYAADWTEYHSHRPNDGSSDLFFHLDPLWSDPDIDFVGIDNYMPLADWRETSAHLDALAGATSIYDLDYLRGNIEGGELFDWYYASLGDRGSQTRTPIADGAYGEHWVFRYKDFAGWWSNAHHNRPGGVRNTSSTAWVPESKPIWFTEVGCPAVDRGANQANVFVDPKSSESFYPYFSSRVRDDAIQRAYIEAVIGYWQPDGGHNPSSSLYDGRMVNPNRIAAWTWDARPYPDFPGRLRVWSDGENWAFGHWLTGRLGSALLRDVVSELTRGLGVQIDASGLVELVHGYMIDRVMSARDAIAPLMTCFFFDATESEGRVVFMHHASTATATFTADALVDEGERGGYRLIRGQESELPRSVSVRYVDRDREYRQASVAARRLTGASDRAVEVAAPVVFDRAEAAGIAEAILAETHIARERAEAVLPPAALRHDPGDVVTLSLDGRDATMRITSLGWELGRPAELVRTDAVAYKKAPRERDTTPPPDVTVPAPPLVAILDLPLFASEAEPHAPWLAAFAKPWTPVAVYRSPTGSGFALDTILDQPTPMGELAADLAAGPVWRWDRASELLVDVPTGVVLEARDDEDVLNGANLGAVLAPSGQWEMLQWAEAELVATNRYRLTRLLRGQFGTEQAIGDPTPAGAPFVVLAPAIVRSAMLASERGLPRVWRWGPSSLPHDDPTYTEETLTIAGIGLRPLSPVHVAAAKSGSDIVLSWIRRTRIGGDSWEGEDVPLAEESESYRIDVLDGSTVVRTLSVSAPTVTYTAAQQTADFGAPASSLTVDVCQVSATFGRGVAVRASFTV